WVIDQYSQTIYKVDSGENVFCSVDIPWLSEDPTSGTLSAGAGHTGASSSQPIALDFEGGSLLPGLRQAQLQIKTDTPVAVPAVPVTLTVRFLDVPDDNQFQAFIYGAAGQGVMFGGTPVCSDNLHFCPNGVVTRADMAGYLFRAIHGLNTPPPVYQNIYGDVSFNDYNAFYIQGITDDGITVGCGQGNYCPTAPNTRAQMSVLIYKGQHGSTPPPPCTPPGVFADVPCPGGFAVDYIEALAAEGVTAGCGGGNFCPNANITNGQMAVFLVKGFNIPYLP
ncbi:MAG: S-layer homology domain-containing protein, partial [Syntrophomonadaceae bacterium]